MDLPAGLGPIQGPARCTLDFAGWKSARRRPRDGRVSCFGRRGHSPGTSLPDPWPQKRAPSSCGGLQETRKGAGFGDWGRT